MKMRSSIALVAASLFAVAQAHFQLQYPAPRGKFVEDDEPGFCDGYTSVNQTRTQFPLTGGVIALNAEHDEWVVGALLSASSSPQSFADFNISGQQVLALPYSKQTGEGVYCLPIDIGKLGLSDVKDGANVTLQIVFNGGDGNLYQCADLTLSSSASTPSDSDLKCKDATNVPTASAFSSSSASATASGASASSTAPSASASGPGSSSASGSGSSSASAASSSPTNGATPFSVPYFSGAAALLMAVMATL